MLNQHNRMLSLHSPLGDNAGVVIAFTGSDHISDIYRYQLTLQVKGHAVRAQDIIGLAVTLELSRDETPQFFHGIVDRWIDAGMDADGTACYQLDVVPRMALLAHARHNRIFENISTVDIVKQVTADCGEKLDSGRLKAYKPREVCTQYGETDLQFVNRLLAEEGIAYYFRHEKDQCTCILVDTASGFGVAHPERCEYVPTLSGHQADAVVDWRHLTQTSSKKITSIDYSEYSPSSPLSALAESPDHNGRSHHGEMQLFGQHYFQRQSPSARQFDADAAGSQIQRQRMAEENDALCVEGASTIAGLKGGLRIKVKNARPDSEAHVLIVSVHHNAGDGNAHTTLYQNSFHAVASTA